MTQDAPRPPLPLGEAWFSKSCAGHDAHVILHDIHGIISKGTIDTEGADRVARCLQPLISLLHAAQCPALCALCIEELKMLAFLDGVENLRWAGLSVLADIWRTGYRLQMKTGGKECNGAEIFDPETCLEGWEVDLPKVKCAALPWYVKLLGCEGLHQSSRFASAAAALVQHVKAMAPEDYSSVAGDVNVGFIDDVLEPLVEGNPEFVVEQSSCAAELAALAAVFRIKRALSHFERLVDKIKTRTDRLGGAYEILNATYRRATDDLPRLLEPNLALLMPKLENRPKRERRRLAVECPASLYVSLNGGEKEFNGEVVDLCDSGHGCHIKFDKNQVVRCTNTSAIGTVPGAAYVNRRVCVSDRAGQNYEFSKGKVKIFPPPAGRARAMEFEGWVLRGFNYETGFNVMKDEAGLVVWYQDEPKRMTEYRLSLRKVLHGEQRSPLIGCLSPIATPVPPAPPRPFGGPFGLRGDRSHMPFMAGARGIVLGLKDWLSSFSDWISRAKGWEVLMSGRKPLGERAIHSLLRKNLEDYVESRGGHLASEADTGLGPCDFLVYKDADRVFIEIKPSYGRIKQGIDAELATYMNASQSQHVSDGVFVVLDFGGEFGPGKANLAELLRRRDKRCLESGVTIHVAVLDCNKPKSASTRKASEVPFPGSGCGFYEYDPTKPQGD